MRLLMILTMLAAVLPMAAMVFWTGARLAGRWREAAPAWRAALILGLGLSFAICLIPHEEVFAGLDVAAYRLMARTFHAGRGFHDRDTVLDQVPLNIRQALYYRPGPQGRPTRDMVFQLSDWGRTKTTPFFQPLLPLAAGGLSPVLSPDRFVPLMGALWLVLVILAGFQSGKGWGLLAAGALALATAWPAWFLRGYYPEAVGSVLIGGVVATAAIRPWRGVMSAVAGWALGLSIGFHPELVMLALPVGVVLVMESRDRKSLGALLGGAVAGLVPLWAMTRWVCHPYGDWTRLDILRQMITLTPELRALAAGFLVAAGIGTGLIALARAEYVRNWLRTGWRSSVVVALLALPCLATLWIPHGLDGPLENGWLAIWTGIRWGMAGLVLAGGLSLFLLPRPMRERVLLAAFCLAALFFIYLKGLETPAGLWSQRRFVPVALAGISLLVAPLGAGLAAVAARFRRTAMVLALGVVVAGGWNLVHWPAPYIAVNEQGATQWARAIEERIGTNRWVIFDYHPHQVPYAPDLKHRVMGLGKSSTGRWPEIAEWISTLAQTQEVWVATAWTPCTLEDGLALDPVFAATGSFPVVNAKNFFPAERGTREVKTSFCLARPVSSSAGLEQVKILDGSPLGLRGPWEPLRNGGAWTRQGSGIIGPVPEPGGQVLFEAECEWASPVPEWPEQVMLVVPPWGGDPLRLAVPVGSHELRGMLARPAADVSRPVTGIYSCRVERPYDPQAFGLRGYAPDLGVVARRIIIRIEPARPSVPD